MNNRKVLAGLIGEEIQGSSSPQMHQDEAAEHGLDLIYRLIDFAQPKREQSFLEPMLRAAESLAFSGLNITHPFKEDALKLVDTLSDDARRIGSINTIVFRDGQLHGDNTDWSGFADNFRATLPEARLDRVALIGTGGAGLAVAYACLTTGAKVLRLFDAKREAAEDLCRSLQKNFPGRQVRVSDSAAEALQAADGLIQATPVGMLGHPGMPIAPGLLHAELWVADIVYFSLETDLLKEAKRRGCRVMGGGGMAVRQAARSFRQFFQVEPDVTRMLQRFTEAHKTSAMPNGRQAKMCLSATTVIIHRSLEDRPGKQGAVLGTKDLRQGGWAKKLIENSARVAVASLGAAVGCMSIASAAPISINPSVMPRIARVDERYQSYNVEMAEVIGGSFWKPYAKQGKRAQGENPAAPSAQSNSASFQIGQDSSMFEPRPPIDLSNVRLRKLAAALGPAYVRVSGTWANSAYFQDSDDAIPTTPPKGFQGILTRREWAGVVDFSHAANAKVVTSFAISGGVRDPAGVWTPKQARRFLAYTKSVGGEIAAAELFNEPTIAASGGAPPGYDAAAFARDSAVFRAFARAAAPGMLILGPGSVGEGIPLMPSSLPMLKTKDLLGATPAPVFDLFSYHFYGAVSMRCASMGAEMTTTAGAALSEEWLSRTERVYDFYAGLRDRFEPGKLIWVTETADAACGGNPWAPTFLDSFRYLDQLGRLARRGVRVVFHNTLAASEYGLIDQTTLAPRPNYWAALLWRRLMGPVVLDAGPSVPGLHLYAHSLRDHPGGVTMLVINTSRTAPESIELPLSAICYTLTAPNLEDGHVQLNGHELKLEANDEVPNLQGRRIPSGRVEFAPASISFLAISEAKNAFSQ